MEGMKVQNGSVSPCLLFLEKEAGQDNPPEKNQKIGLFLNMIH